MSLLVILAIFLAKLLDPVAIVLGILNGYLSRSMAVLVALSVGIAIAGELLLKTTQVVHEITLLPLVMGSLAAFAWSWLAFSIRKARRPVVESEKPE